MCGIAGYFLRYDPHSESAQKLVSIMSQILAHSGRSYMAHWLSSDQRVLIVHSRCKTVARSSSMPHSMTDYSGRFVIALDGDIYNMQAIRQELSLLGQRPRMPGEVELIAAAYRQWGTGMLHYLEGNFSFVLFDVVQQELLLVRDAAGVRGLYWHEVGQAISFSSNIRVLQKIPWMTYTINPISITTFVMHGVIPAPYTLYDSIKSLEQGSFLMVRKSDYRQAIWYDPYATINQSLFDASGDEIIDWLSSVFTRAVRQRYDTESLYTSVLLDAHDSYSLLIAVVGASIVLRARTLTISLAGEHIACTKRLAEYARYLTSDHLDLVVTRQQVLEVFHRIMMVTSQPLSEMQDVIRCVGFSMLQQASVSTVLCSDVAVNLFGDQCYSSHALLNWLRSLYQSLKGIKTCRADCYLCTSSVHCSCLLQAYNQKQRSLLIKTHQLMNAIAYRCAALTNISMCVGGVWIRFPFVDVRLYSYGLHMSLFRLNSTTLTQNVMHQFIATQLPRVFLNKHTISNNVHQEWYMETFMSYIQAVLSNDSANDLLTFVQKNTVVPVHSGVPEHIRKDFSTIWRLSMLIEYDQSVRQR